MFNQDEPKEKKEKMAPIPERLSETKILDAQSSLSFMLSESRLVRERYGIGHKESKFFIADIAVINKLDEHTKAMLRVWVKIQKANGKWE